MRDYIYYICCGNDYLGKCIFSKTKNEIFIKYITIFVHYRGNKLMPIFYDMLEKIFIDLKCTTVMLMAEERTEKYGKLEQLYKSIGFIPIKYHDAYNGDYPIRHIKMVKYLFVKSKL